MASRIGSDLRRARERRETSLEEVEAATRIRTRFLRAIEEEDWGALPGGVYSRAFIRTYAGHLGLDGERLAEDFRREVEGARSPREPARDLAPVAASGATGSPGGRRSLRYLRWLAIPAVLAVAVAAVVLIPGDGGDQSPAGGGGGGGPAAREKAVRGPQPKPSGVELQFVAEAEVWVCLLDAKGRPLVGGQVLEAGAEEGPYRSGSFTLSLGNGEVTMTIDGKQAQIPPTPSPVGYAVEAGGRLTELEESERPTCT